MTNKFKMNRGYCHLYQDKLVFNAHKELRPEDITRKSFGNYGIRFIFGSILTLCFYFIYQDVSNGESPSILLSVFGLFFLLIFITTLRMTSKVLIDIDSIEFITYKPSGKRLNAIVYIHYKDKKNKIKQQLVMLPLKVDGEHKAFENAKAMFEHLGFGITEELKK